MQTIEGYTTHQARVRELQFNWLEWGSPDAPSLVLLHGLTGHAHTWDHMAQVLADKFHIFVPDQRGHGDTEHADMYATREFVDDLEALARHWGLDRFALIGLSMGGHNAMAYAAAQPERVTQLVVIDIPARMDRTLAPNWPVISKLAVTGHKRFGSLEEAYGEARQANRTAPDDNLRYRTHHNLAQQADGTFVLKYDPKAPARWQPEDLTSKVATIACPTLIVRGELSEVISPAGAERLREMFQRADLVEVPGSGHSVPTDRPEALSRVVLDWLRRQRGSQGLL